MSEKKSSYLVLMRQSSDELARKRFFRRCDVKYWYVASALAICQLTILVCYLEPSWLVVKIGRYTLLLGVWGYCLTIESFEDCVYFYKTGPWDAQSIVLRLFQLMETLLLVLSLVSLIAFVSCRGRWSGARYRGRSYFPLVLDLLLVSSGVAAFGGVLAFYMTFITYATTDDETVLTLLNDRRPGWAIIVSFIAYCFVILFSIILISVRGQTSNLGVNDNELTAYDAGVEAEGVYEIADDAVVAGVKQSDDVSIETYENPSTTAEKINEQPVAGKDEPGESMKEMWEEASCGKEDLEKELKEKTEEELCRQQEENLRKQGQQEETKTSELTYYLAEVDEKPQDEEEKDKMLQTQTKDEDVASQETLREYEDEREEETNSGDDRQEEVAREQNKREEELSTDIIDDRLNAKVLIPECPSMDSLKKKKKKKMKLCCNS